MSDLATIFDSIDLEPRPAYLKALENEKAFEMASREGLMIYIPNEHEIALDIDSPELPANYEELKSLLSEYFTIKKERITTSRSGNKHVYLTFENSFTPAEKVALQAALGSDPKREILSLIRAWSMRTQGWSGYPSLMFEVPCQ